MNQYVHGYTQHENQRLIDQSHLLSRLFYENLNYPPGSIVLEAGSGVGSQTAHLVQCGPDATFVSLDLCFESLQQARVHTRQFTGSHDRLLQGNVYQLPFPGDCFDHVFVCFVLEHLSEPERALLELKRVLKPKGTMTVIEGDHGSCFFHPQSDEAMHVWNCLIEAQAQLGGDSLIGRRMYPLLHGAGLDAVEVTPHFIYADAGRPEWVDYFTIKTICAMVEGVCERSFEMELSDPERWERGMQALRRTAESPDGTFCYTFFQGRGTKLDPCNE